MKSLLHYEVRFKFFSYNNNDNITIQQYNKPFYSENLIEARKEAFAEFEEYLAFIKDRLIKGEDGNYKIKQGENINKIIDDYRNKYETANEDSNRKSEEIMNLQNIDNENDSTSLTDELIIPEEMTIAIKNLLDYHEIIKRYKESVAVYLIIDENSDNVNRFFNEEKVNIIHQISSNEIDFQSILDSLCSEKKVYDFYNFDKGNLERTVKYYGADFQESGFQESALYNEILTTPFDWSYYQIPREEVAIKQESIEDSSDITIEDLINLGEGKQVEFKPFMFWNKFTKEKDYSIFRKQIARTICAFLNTDGGYLIIGVGDKKEINGLNDFDYTFFQNNPVDEFLREYAKQINYNFSLALIPFISSGILKVNDKDIFIIKIAKNPDGPVYLTTKVDGLEKKIFYVRLESTTRQIEDIEDITAYILRNWRK